MAEEHNTDTAQAPVGGENAPAAGMVAQYIKDLSFENPNAPASFQNAGGAPAIDVNVNVGVRQMNEEMFEVELKISAKATNKDESGNDAQAAFVVELAYAGLFGMRNIPEDQAKPFLLINAPMMMFPFARRIIADATRDGGFMPLMLDVIDFGALYRQQQMQAEGQADAANAEGAPQPINLN